MPGPPASTKRRDALIDADGIGIGKTQRAIGVDVDVYPAGTKIVAGHIDDLRIRGNVPRTHELDLAIGKMHVRDSVDSLFGDP